VREAAEEVNLKPRAAVVISEPVKSCIQPVKTW
jgi:hypothetical protein